jgi:hypothetical protein
VGQGLEHVPRRLIVFGQVRLIPPPNVVDLQRLCSIHFKIENIHWADESFTLPA